MTEELKNPPDTKPVTSQKAPPAPPLGNKRAQKGDEPATATVQMRVTPTRKAQYVEAADSAGMKLSEWLINLADRELANSKK